MLICQYTHDKHPHLCSLLHYTIVRYIHIIDILTVVECYEYPQVNSMLGLDDADTREHFGQLLIRRNALFWSLYRKYLVMVWYDSRPSSCACWWLRYWFCHVLVFKPSTHQHQMAQEKCRGWMSYIFWVKAICAKGEDSIAFRWLFMH